MLLILAECFQVLPLIFFRYLRVLAKKFAHLCRPILLACFKIYVWYLSRKADPEPAALSVILAP